MTKYNILRTSVENRNATIKCETRAKTRSENGNSATPGLTTPEAGRQTKWPNRTVNAHEKGFQRIRGLLKRPNQLAITKSESLNGTKLFRHKAEINLLSFVSIMIKRKQFITYNYSGMKYTNRKVNRDSKNSRKKPWYLKFFLFWFEIIWFWSVKKWQKLLLRISKKIIK